MSYIPPVLPHTTQDINTPSPRNCIGSLVGRIIDVAKAAFNLIATAVTAVASFIYKAVVYVLDTAYNAIYWVLSMLGCAETRDPAAYDYTGVSLNMSAIDRAPDPLDLDQLAATGMDIDVNDIVNEYDNTVRAYRAAGNGRNETSRADREALRDLARMSVSQGSTPYQIAYYSTVKKVLQNLILELRRPETSADKKMRALDEIIVAQSRCAPRRLAECIRQYKLLKTSNPEMVQLLLEHIQDFKEDFFLEAFERSGQFHVINHIRREHGDRYGLNRSLINLEDPHINCGGPPDASRVHAEFNRRYTSEGVVEGVMARLQVGECNQICLDYIRNELEIQARRRGENPQDENVAERIGQEATGFFNDTVVNGRNQSVINQAGVIFLLRGIGILNPA